MSTTNSKKYRTPIDALKLKEMEFIMARTYGDEEPLELPWGLALSGGGIRSATYSLGVLQALAKLGWLGGFHYLSTISGGGYTGALVQALMKDDVQSTQDADETTKTGQQGDDVMNLLAAMQSTSGDASLRDPTTLRAMKLQTHLRMHSRYLGPQKSLLSLDSISIAANYLINLVVVQFQVLPMLLFLMLASLLIIVWTVRFFHAYELIAFFALSLSALIAMYRGWPGPNGRKSNAWDLIPPLISLQCVVVPFMMEGEDVGASTVAIAITYSALLASWSLSDKELREEWSRRLLAAIISGCALYLSLKQISRFTDRDFSWVNLVVLSLCVYVAFSVSAIIYAGLASESSSDDEREVLARLLGRVGRVLILLFVLPVTLLIYIPSTVHYLSHGHTPDWALVVSWFLLLPIALWWLSGRNSDVQLRTILGPAMLACIGVILTLSAVGLHAFAGLVPKEELASLGLHLTWVTTEIATRKGELFLITGVSMAMFVTFAILIDENKFSMSAFYRSRLTRCYLDGAKGCATACSLDANADFSLKDLAESCGKSKRPRPLYPLIGAAANLPSDHRLDWQDRRAASFVFSPLYCGHIRLEDQQDRTIGDPPPSVQVASSGPLSKNFTLGMSTAVSGAAVSSTMGYHDRPGLAFLMTLLNLRLGAWVKDYASDIDVGCPSNATDSSCNPAASTRVDSHKRRLRSAFARIPGWNLFCELTGSTWGVASAVHVSDGGHFENLGIYELLRRECRFIVCVDATADPERNFFDLGNAVHKARVDLGVEIDIDVSKLRIDSTTGLSRRNAAVGRVRYPGGSHASGIILYIKPSLIGEEPVDVQRYSGENRAFPHEPTINQFYGEYQYESYRQLGYSNTYNLLRQIGLRPTDAMESDQEQFGAASRAPISLTSSVSRKEELLRDLEHWLYEPIDAVRLHASMHSRTLSALISELRRNSQLAVLDRQLHPGWSNAIDRSNGECDQAAHQALPSGEAFRECFYFCQQLLQLMESVFSDLDLGRNWNHPDNRGWLNLFKHWTWVPTFRVVWALSAQTHGSRFTRFCERRLGLPSCAEALIIECLADASDSDKLREHARVALNTGRISFVEERAIEAVLEAWTESNRMPSRYLCIRAFLDWKLSNRSSSPFLIDSQCPRAISAGVAIVDQRTGRMILFRIQDHLRRLGLGAAFMRKLLEDRVSLGVGSPLIVDAVSLNQMGARSTLAPALADGYRQAIIQLHHEAHLATASAGRHSRGA